MHSWDEYFAFELLKQLNWDDLVHPINGIPKVVATFKKLREHDAEGRLKAAPLPSQGDG
jgi:hypothetical protein